MKSSNKNKITSLGIRFLYTCFLTLMIAYFCIKLQPLKGAFNIWLIPYKNWDFLRNSFLIIFTLIPITLFFIQLLLRFCFKKPFPVKKISCHKKFSIFMIICTILSSGIPHIDAPSGLGILPFIPYMIFFYCLYVFWILRELKNNYTLKWSIPIIILAYCLFTYVRNDLVCPKETPLYEFGICYSCNEPGYLKPDNCFACTNRYEKNGRCYLRGR